MGVYLYSLTVFILKFTSTISRSFQLVLVANRPGNAPSYFYAGQRKMEQSRIQKPVDDALLLSNSLYNKGKHFTAVMQRPYVAGSPDIQNACAIKKRSGFVKSFCQQLTLLLVGGSLLCFPSRKQLGHFKCVTAVNHQSSLGTRKCVKDWVNGRIASKSQLNHKQTKQTRHTQVKSG